MSSISEKKHSLNLPDSPDVSYAEHQSVNLVGDAQNLVALGYEAELHRNRSTFTLLFQSLAIAAIPYGYGGPLISSIYGGGQLSMFLGWVLVLILTECTALSLAELASRYPTSGGAYYWSFQLSSPKSRTVLSFITGWVSLIGSWTITLSVNFGFASMMAAAVALYHPDIEFKAWQLLLIFYALLLLTFGIVAFGNKVLPAVDTICAVVTLISIIGNYDTSLSGWGDFSFFIGMLPTAYTFSAIGMITSMAEECRDPARKLPKAMSLCVPVGGIAGTFFVIPLCATLPPLADILSAPVGQALPYIYEAVMDSPGAALALTALVLVVILFCSISITVAASRCTWAFARDNAIPFAPLWSKVNERHGTPIGALTLVTAVEMVLGLINLGSSSAFIAFVSVGVIALAVSYAIPITISMLNHRKEVNSAPWTLGKPLGWIVNIIALSWISFEVVLFSMPTVLPVTQVSMNYAIVVFFGFMALSAMCIQGAA